MLKKYFLNVLIFIVLVVFIISTFNNRNKPAYDTRDLEQVKNELPYLMAKITKDLRSPDETQDRVRPSGYTYLAYYYDNPRDVEINLIMNNISNDSSWNRVPTRYTDDKNIFASYCNDTLGLNLSKYPYQKSVFDEEYPRLRINIFYYSRSDCNIK